MSMDGDSSTGEARLTPYLSQWGAWAFALGAAIGWGSLIVTTTTYLLQAGPVGSVLGLIAGAAIMIVIARNYHTLINRFSGSGGAYTFAKEILGYDYAFMAAWLLALVYFAILWANATSVPLFVRYFIGNVFQVGYCFTLFGYDVYLGEALLSMCAVLLVAILCGHSRKGTGHFMTAMAIVLSACIVFCFLAALVGHMRGGQPVDPVILSDAHLLKDVVRISCISSWAFIGFGNISHFSDEYAFPRSKSFKIMTLAVVASTALYVFIMLLSLMAYPPEYPNWFAYLADSSNLEGIKGLPAFYAASRYLGAAGVRLLMLALACLVLTSLISHMTALSRLFFALAKDEVLPRHFVTLGSNGIPTQSVAAVALLSLPIPFLGRTAVSWMVDVTTIGATAIYGLVSVLAYRTGIVLNNRSDKIFGVVGMGLMVASGIYLIVPSLLFISQDLQSESYFIFAVWGLLGFILFRVLLANDTQHRFGRSIIVWIGLLSIVLFVAFLWTNEAVAGAFDTAVGNIIQHALSASGATANMSLATYAEEQRAAMNGSILFTTLGGMGILVLAAALLLSNLSYISRWAQASEKELDLTKDILDNDPLTGLHSAKRFAELAPDLASRIRAEGAVPVMLAFDLMGMKDFNTMNGWSAGDDLLITFARNLTAQFGADSCARQGDGFFCALVPQEGLADRVTSLFQQFAGANGGSSLPVRAGAYVIHPNDDVIAVGLDHARIARDDDRTTWQSHLTWYAEAMAGEAAARLHVLDHLDRAIAERWIRPYYQAVVNAQTGVVVEEEALARWIDPENGFLSPAQFIPIIEKAGLLHKVDMHMVDCVLQDMVTKREAGINVVPVSVNISLNDLGHLDVADEITRRVDAAGIPHELLHVEFTESVASRDPELLRASLNSLRSLGFEVWMDDFGSGYSSLNSLKDFTFDVVKLDMEFLRGAQNERSWDIVSGVIDIVRNIGAQALTEGVETAEQAERLTDAGCDMLQGFLYSKPLPLEQVIEYARSGELLR